MLNVILLCILNFQFLTMSARQKLLWIIHIGYFCKFLLFIHVHHHSIHFPWWSIEFNKTNTVTLNYNIFCISHLQYFWFHHRVRLHTECHKHTHADSQILPHKVKKSSMCIIRRWAGKTSHVHFAPEYVFTTKHPRRTEWNYIHTCSRYPTLLTEIPNCVWGQGTCFK